MNERSPISDSPPVAVLTGAGSGIGAATARRLAESGHRLVLLGRSIGALEELGRELGGGAAGDPVVVAADLARTEELARTAAGLAERFESVAAVVNCAGAMLNRRAERTGAAELNHLLAVNVSAPFLLTQALFDPLRAAGGSVVNVVSVSALQGVVAQSAYSASKGALLALSRSMAAEWGTHGIRVNAVAPGVVLTPMSADYAVEPYEQHLNTNIPLGRWGRPDDVATAIAFLCSDAARYITGQVIAIDGGLSSLNWMSTVRARAAPATGGRDHPADGTAGNKRRRYSDVGPG